MIINEISRNVHDVILTYKSGQDFWFLLSSDRHWDNPDSDLAMQEKHLKQAKERGALVFDAGDLFCAMQGKYDKRSDKSKLRPEHQHTNYLDKLVETAADFFAPYTEQLAVVGLGNHETAILKNHETNLTERLIERLKIKGDKTVHMGGYTGYIRLRFRTATGGSADSFLIHYNHGWGGGGAVTHGTIQSQRQAVYNPDPDLIFSGHVHEQYVFPIEQIRMNDLGRLYQRTQYHVRTPTYKNEYKDGYGGFHVETGKPPKPIGAYWLNIKVSRCSTGGKSRTILEPNFLFAK